MIYNMDCRDYLEATTKKYRLIFLDPPDNCGLAYDTYVDKLPDYEYIAFLMQVIGLSSMATDVLWISYDWKHDLALKSRIGQYNTNKFDWKPFVWRYTFGQHNRHDCGSGYRPMLRISSPGTKFYPEHIYATSTRQRIGDKRASKKGRVPDNFWCFGHPRLVKNHPDYRDWHPTQHPKNLMSQIVRLCTKPGDSVLDLFGGTGSTLRACLEIDRDCDTCELSRDYCERIAKETGVEIRTSV